jgi:hypothetical protein
VILDLGLLLLLSRPGRLFAPQRPRAAVSLSSDRSAYRMSIPTSPGWTGLADRPPICWIRCMQAASSASVIPYRPGL